MSTRMEPLHAYLDNHTTTRPSAAAIEAMLPFLNDKWGLPSAPHSMGQELLRPMREAYESIYALLGASEFDSVVLTSSGTEAINHAVHAAYLDVARETGRNHFLTSEVDEAPVIMAYERLELLGCETGMIAVNKEGIVTVDALIDAITPRTAMVCISWANAMTGVIHPVAELAEVCRERGILFCLDATHVLGRIDFDLDEIAPDMVAFNGDHLHAPKGTGGLYIRSGLRLSPLLLGGMEQDGQRAGSVSVANLVALGVAAHEALDQRDHVAMEIARLRNKLEKGAYVFFEGQERLPTTTCLAFEGVVADALLYRLSRAEVLASFGGGHFQQLSLQLVASGILHPLADCAITLTLSRMTTEEEIDRAVEVIGKTYASLRELSMELV